MAAQGYSFRASVLALAATASLFAGTLVQVQAAQADEVGASIVIQVDAGVSHATATITNQWDSGVLVTSQGGTVTRQNVSYLDGEDSTTVTGLDTGDTITVTESLAGKTFRSWDSWHESFVKGAAATIQSMPAMSTFTTDAAGTTAGEDFFSGFNSEGTLTALPAGSFNTSAITKAGTSFFSGFNSEGKLKSLPVGSFKLSGITAAGGGFFSGFNWAGELASLPAGSFNTENIRTAGHGFFDSFNAARIDEVPVDEIFVKRVAVGGLLTSLPAGSFRFGVLSSVGERFLASFNSGGRLGKLPAGSFAFPQLARAGDYFCAQFGAMGGLSELPAGSFAMPKLTKVGDYFFSGFVGSKLTKLPARSFDISAITGVGDGFFYGFNAGGALKSLPAGSFDTSNIKTAGNDFFAYFNAGDYNGGSGGVGRVTSLPAGSFRLSSLTTVGNDFFASFNDGGYLNSLPAGSFNTSKIKTVGKRFFKDFNGWYNGKLTGSSKKGVTIYNASASTITFQIYSKKAFADGLNWKEVKVKPGKVFKYYSASAPVKKLTATPKPKVTGKAKVGKPLTAKPGSWKPSKVILKYQWLRDGKAITGATKSKYKLVGADKGKKLTVRVTGSKSGYTAVAKTSRATKKVAAGTLTKAIPKISGTAEVGKPLAAKAGKWKPAGTTLKYQWLRNGKAITGATASKYTLVEADRGKKISVKVTGSKTGYSTASKTSKQTGKIKQA